MRENTSIKQLFATLIIVTLIAFIGCDKKSEQKEGEMKMEEKSTDTISSIQEPVVETPVITIPDSRRIHCF